LVLIVGEPGIGKSRLIEELHSRLTDTPHTWVEWSCSQLLQNTPLHPIAEWGRQRFGGPDVPAEHRLADLENTLALVKLNPAKRSAAGARPGYSAADRTHVALGTGGTAATAVGRRNGVGVGERANSTGSLGL
jgi:predicted ATPase